MAGILGGLISGGSGIISGLISNIAGGIKAGIAHKQAKKAAASVGLENFKQQQFLQQLQEKRRALESGSAYQAQQEAIRQQGALAGSNVLKLGGGAVGTAISALNRINRSTGRNLNELYGNMSMEGLQMQNLIGQTVQSMANREYSIKAMAAGQALAESKQTSKDVMANAMGTLSSLTSGLKLGGIGGGTVNQPITNAVMGGGATTAPTAVTQGLGLQQGTLSTIPSISGAYNTPTYSANVPQNIQVPQAKTFQTSDLSTPIANPTTENLPVYGSYIEDGVYKYADNRFKP